MIGKKITLIAPCKLRAMLLLKNFCLVNVSYILHCIYFRFERSKNNYDLNVCCSFVIEILYLNNAYTKVIKKKFKK